MIVVIDLIDMIDLIEILVVDGWKLRFFLRGRVPAVVQGLQGRWSL